MFLTALNNKRSKNPLSQYFPSNVLQNNNQHCLKHCQKESRKSKVFDCRVLGASPLPQTYSVPSSPVQPKPSSPHIYLNSSVRLLLMALLLAWALSACTQCGSRSHPSQRKPERAAAPRSPVSSHHIQSEIIFFLVADT